MPTGLLSNGGGIHPRDQRVRPDGLPYSREASMNSITIEHALTDARLSELGVRSWPIWKREASEFPWFAER